MIVFVLLHPVTISILTFIQCKEKKINQRFFFPDWQTSQFLVRISKTSRIAILTNTPVHFLKQLQGLIQSTRVYALCQIHLI